MSRTIPQWIKDAKYSFCAICGRTDDLQYHHWIPVEQGGENIPENIIVLCAEHHQQFHEQGGRIKHNYLIKDGIAKARERGVKVGRKPRSDESDILRTIAENSTQFNKDSLMTENEIMEKLDLGLTQYSKYKRKLLFDISASVWPHEWSKPTQALKRPLYDHVIKKKRGDYA